jgi:hypothetical protein
VAPLVLPINVGAIGEFSEIFPVFTSVSGSPTICHTFFSPLSSSISVMVAPNLMASPKRFDTSITSAPASLSSSSAVTRLVDFSFGSGGVIFRILSEI